MKRVLIFGLPGAGKSTLAAKLQELIECDWYNADRIRTEYNDWDFSPEGRDRQMRRMRERSIYSVNMGRYAVCDFVCPTKVLRRAFNADIYVWMNTIDKGRFEDTNMLFENPVGEDCITINKSRWWSEEDVEYWAKSLVSLMKESEFDDQKPTVQMLGRFQPWHAGHQALFERAFSKTGQVYLMVRNMPTSDSNPYDAEEVITNIRSHLIEWAGKFKCVAVPNIVNITYGRDVGYKIEQEVFDPTIHDISATKIREQLKREGKL